MTSRTYQHGLLVANSAQRHCSSIDIDIDPTSSSSSNEVHLDLGSSSSSTTNDNSNASTRYAAAYLACIAGGSLVPHKDRPPRHMKPSSSSSYSTHQNSSPLLWIYNCKTHRWRSTYLTIGNSLSTASSFVNIPHMNDDQYCPRTNTPSFMHSTHSLDELVPCSSPIPMMSVKSIDSSSSPSCPSTPLAHSSFDYGDFSNHSSMDVGGYYYYYSPPPPPPSSDRRPVKSSPMKIANYSLPSSPKHTIITSTLNNNKDDIMKGKQRQLGFFEPTRQQRRRRRRSSSVLISEHSHLAGGVFVVFAVAWHGIHTIILLTQRRSSHCLEIVSREVTKASSMVGMPHPAVHKVIQLPPGYLPTLLEMRDVTAVCHSKEGTSTAKMSSPPIRFPHDWREKTGSSKQEQEQENITHTESNAAGMDSRCSSSGLDIADTCCVVVVSDGRTMLCYSISRELQRVGKKSQQHQQQPPHISSSSYEHHIGSGTRASSRTTGGIYDYTVVELWDIHIASLTEQQHLLTVRPCLRMRSTSTATASFSSSSSGHGRIVLPIRETHLLFIRSCPLSGEP